MNSGFCNLRDIGIVQLTAESEDTLKRSLAIAMIERCPSGALTYQLDPDEPDVEPDLPQEIAETFEVTSQGRIRGPLGYRVFSHQTFRRPPICRAQPGDFVLLREFQQ